MKSSSKVIISVLLVVSLGLAAFSGLTYVENQDKEKRINNLQTDYESLSQNYDNLKTEKEDLQTDYESLTRDYEKLKERLTPSISTYYFLTVSDNKGSVNPFEVALLPGEGSLQIEISDTRFEADAQESSQTARDVANLHLEENLKTEKDLHLDLDVDDLSTFIYGPSAGAAQTLAIISAGYGEPIDNDVLITGTIEPDGSIEKVGGVEAKIEAAKDFGAKKMLVPEGQYKEVAGIDVKEISHIEEAMIEVGLEPKEVTYPEIGLKLADFSFVNEVRDYQDYDEHSNNYEPDEIVSIYFEVEDFELDDDGYARYEQYVTLYRPDGTVDSFYDNYLNLDGSLEGAEIIWMVNDLEPPERGWMKGEFEIEIRVVDIFGNKDIKFTRNFEVS